MNACITRIAILLFESELYLYNTGLSNYRGQPLPPHLRVLLAAANRRIHPPLHTIRRTRKIRWPSGPATNTT